jgi:hypothetical protein
MANYDDIIKMARRNIYADLENRLQTLKEDFRNEEPVDTGRSKASWHIVKHQNSLELINDAKDPITGMHYPHLLFNGWSKQLPLGHWPTYYSWIASLQAGN